MKLTNLFLTAAMASLSIGAMAASPAIETFDNGTDGWVGRGGLPSTGSTIVDPSVGNQAPSLHTTYNDFLLNGFRDYTDDTNDTYNSHFLGNYTASKSVTIGIDVDTLSLGQATNPPTSTARDLTVEFDDYKDAQPGSDYLGLSYDLGALKPGAGWQSMSVTIADTSSATLPAGWTVVGYVDGDFNPVTTLPPGITFSEILANVDEFAFQSTPRSSPTTLTSFDIAVDNISVSGDFAVPVPEPATYGMLLAGLGALAFMIRRRKD